ncbi:bifunctional UDP-sugar hydrolase/5'-nucleotidase [Prevotella sp. E15-22]|uniref:bifunctional metallophosphatase/5'-nucleotidase n=1 Tax=Prevotella sp. E15-22 TaxID=2937774 RepID=UPI0035308A35
MRRIVMMIALLLVVVCGSAKGTKKITVLHTSDTHSCILPLNKSLADTLLADRGGFLRRIAMLKQERQKEPNLLLFDCGDFSQGSSYYTMFKGDVEVELMNRMHYDAATIGNHEFDFGLDNMIRLFKMAEFPIVCSNYDFGDTELKDIVKPYIVLKRQGVKIGVFALCPPLEGLVSAKNYGPLKFLDPVEVTTRMVDVLRRQEKCDVVICLSHLGWEVSEYPDDKFISQTSGIDLVLGGHSHTYLKTLGYVTDKEGRQVPVDHEGKHAVFVGKMQLTLTRNKE